jgi:hypothetical protein
VAHANVFTVCVRPFDSVTPVCVLLCASAVIPPVSDRGLSGQWADSLSEESVSDVSRAEARRDIAVLNSVVAFHMRMLR